MVASNSASLRVRRSSSTMAASRPTSTRSGVSGFSSASATAMPTSSGPGRPSGPTSVLTVALHCSCNSA